MVDVFDNEPSLLDSIALKLDIAKKPVGNWRSLALKLISTGQLFKAFESQLHSSENPTTLLFRYLHKNEKFSRLTVGALKGHLENMQRKDILMTLDGVQGLYLCKIKIFLSPIFPSLVEEPTRVLLVISCLLDTC